MSWRMRSYSPLPPGEFVYREDEFYAKGPDITQMARDLTNFRKANNRPRAFFVDAIADIDAAQCQRLGNDPKYCMNTDVDFKATNPIVRRVSSGGCGTCGKRRR